MQGGTSGIHVRTRTQACTFTTEPAQAGGKRLGRGGSVWFQGAADKREIGRPACAPLCQPGSPRRIGKTPLSPPLHHACDLAMQAGSPRLYGEMLDVHVVVGGPGLRRLPPPLTGLLSEWGQWLWAAGWQHPALHLRRCSATHRIVVKSRLPAWPATCPCSDGAPPPAAAGS